MADELIEDIKNFNVSIWNIKKNFEKIQSDKISYVNMLATHSLNQEDVGKCLEKLERINRLEERYFKLIYKHLKNFVKKIKRINNSGNFIPNPSMTSDERKFLQIGEKYINVLIDVSNNLDVILKKAKERIDKEESHIRKARKNLTTTDQRKNFIIEYEKFLKSFSKEAKIEMAVRKLNQKYALLQSLKRNLNQLANKLGLERDYERISVIPIFGVIIGLALKGDIIGALFGLVIGLGGYIGAINHAKKQFRNIISKTKFRL